MLCLVLLQLTPSVAPNYAYIKAVYVEDNEIVVNEVGHAPRILTHDNLRKSLPVWSPDGSKIAFFRDISASKALVEVVVITSVGKDVANILIKPASQGSPQLMRYAQALCWLSETRIAVSGSVIPELSEVVVVDLRTGSIIKDEQVEDPGIFYSPDGEQYAYEAGRPHFSPESSFLPRFVGNDKEKYPGRGVRVHFLSTPRWSADSKRVAILAEDDATKERSVVIWRGPSQVLAISIGRGEGAADLFWDGAHLAINTNEKQLRWSEPDSFVTELEGPPEKNPLKAASELRKKISLVEAPGVCDPDYWCSSCALTYLPRANPVNGIGRQRDSR